MTENPPNPGQAPPRIDDRALDYPVVDPVMHRAMAPYWRANAGHYGEQCLALLAIDGPIELVSTAARLAASYGLDALNGRL